MIALTVVILLAWIAPAAADTLDVRIGYLRGTEIKQTISLLDVPAENDGIAGAQLALRDNNTTGRFLGQTYSLDEARLKEGEDPAAAVAALADRGVRLVIADLPADALLKAADAGRERGMVLFNVGAIDDRVREQDCRANLVHTAPTRSMLADGLAQYLVWKRWRRWRLSWRGAVFGGHRVSRLGNCSPRSMTWDIIGSGLISTTTGDSMGCGAGCGSGTSAGVVMRQESPTFWLRR